MNSFKSLWNVLRRKSDLTEEFESHLRMAVADRVARGESPEDARREAIREFGNVPLIADVTRERWGWLRMEQTLQDLRYTLRTLGRDRGFTFVAIIILALGIGANIVVFSVVNTILLRPLPFAQPQQLVVLKGNYGQLGLSDTSYRIDWWEAYKRSNKSFQAVTGYVPYFAQTQSKLMNHGEPKPVAGAWVLQDFFPTMGVNPLLGRQFLLKEAVKGGQPVVMLSYAFWQREFHGDPAIVGKTITLDKDALTVVGVLPESFDFGAVFAPGSRMDYFTLLVPDAVRQWGHVLAMIGRLKPGVTVAQAQAEANILFPQLRDTLKLDGDTDYKTTMTGLKEEVSGKLRRSLEVLWCAVGMILLIVCVNLSNLLIARAAMRSKEFALRISLGAGRGRLVRQLLTESLVLSGAGALLGLAFAYAATSWLAHQGSVALPLMSSVRVDGTVLGWTVVVAVAVGLLFGLAPGLKMSAGNLQESLKDSGPGTSNGRKHERIRAVLVISEVALACVLIVGAGLLLRSFLRVMDVDLGFRPEQTSAIKGDYSTDYNDDGSGATKRSVAFEEMQRQVRAIPGVEAVGITDNLPLEHGRSWDLSAKEKPAKPGENKDAFVYIVTPGYLDAMGMHLRAGRDFTWADGPKGEHVIIINQTAARREWPGEDPIGKLARGIGDGDTRVIGVIDDVRESGVEEGSSPQVYVPVTQGEPGKAEIVLRSKLPVQVLEPTVMRVLRSMNPGQATVPLRPIQSIVDHATSPRRFFAVLVGLFAVLGLILASLGIYGVISYSVTRQTQEIGIRMALGATRERVQMGVISKTLRMALIGVAVGTVASFAVARAISSQLFGTEPTDPVTFAGMIVLLTAVAFFAGYLPARRASRIDPMVALRSN
jgi:predicted permease